MVSKLFAVAVLKFLFFACACPAGESWKLPSGTPAKEDSPRTYLFTVDYITSDSKGQIVQHQQVQGEYTRGLPGGMAEWNNITVTDPVKDTERFGPAKTRPFMNGFRYPRSSFNPMAPDFFKGFPAASISERNLVWDTAMLEFFGQAQWDHLKLNQVYHVSKDEDVNMPGVGTFRNRDVELMWTGRSNRNGRDCALIEYQAFFNPLDLAVEGMKLKGRSHYWGQIWVSLDTRQIEYATLYEDVLAEMTLSGCVSMQVTNAFRHGIFRPLDGK